MSSKCLECLCQANVWNVYAEKDCLEFDPIIKCSTKCCSECTQLGFRAVKGNVDGHKFK